MVRPTGTAGVFDITGLFLEPYSVVSVTVPLQGQLGACCSTCPGGGGKRMASTCSSKHACSYYTGGDHCCLADC